MLFLAQAVATAPTTDWFVFFAQAGVAGGVLLWFMWRDGKQTEKTDARLQAIENAFHRVGRANLILVLSLKQADATAKGEAQKLIDEIDEHLK